MGRRSQRSLSTSQQVFPGFGQRCVPQLGSEAGDATHGRGPIPLPNCLHQSPHRKFVFEVCSVSVLRSSCILVSVFWWRDVQLPSDILPWVNHEAFDTGVLYSAWMPQNLPLWTRAHDSNIGSSSAAHLFSCSSCFPVGGKTIHWILLPRLKGKLPLQCK